MGKFNNTKYSDTIDNLVNASKSKIANQYYLFLDKQPTKVTYFSQNIERSTLDQSSGLHEAHIGNGSPFKFNKIKDFIIYGIEKISTEYDLGDNGIESSEISGSGIVLPNTIMPRPGDFFKINYIKENILFKITGVSSDTLDTGANIYKFDYKLEKTDISSLEEIEKQVVKEFKFIPDNIGTDYKTILYDHDFDLINKIEGIIEYLVTCFDNIFFDKNLQTFIFNHDGWKMYDPYLIEFIIRNQVLKFGSKYTFVSHATSLNKTFSMDYENTFFKSLEDLDLDKLKNGLATADLITDPNSLFVTRLNDYYSIRYIDDCPYKTRFNTIDPDVIDHIKNNKLYEKGNKKEYYNIWILYFNNIDFVNDNFMKLINSIKYSDNMEYFYSLVITAYILEKYICNILYKKKKESI